MSNIKDFYVLRYSVINEEPTLIPPRSLPQIKGDVILSALLSDFQWENKGTNFQFIGFSKKELDKDLFYIGKIAKLKKAHLGVKTDEDIIDREADDWKAVILIVDTKNQYIFARKNSSFGDLGHVCRSLAIGINKIVLPEYNHKVFVEPVPSKGQFWEIVKSSEKIYKIELTMISPNILETNKKTREALETMKKLFNQDKTTIEIINAEGELLVPHNPTEGYIDYIEEGEGKWKIDAVNKETKNRKVSSSDDSPDILDIDIEKIAVDKPEKMNSKQLEIHEFNVTHKADFLLKIKEYIKSKVREL